LAQHSQESRVGSGRGHAHHVHAQFAAQLQRFGVQIKHHFQMI